MSKKPNKKVKKEVERKESASMKGAFWFFGSGWDRLITLIFGLASIAPALGCILAVIVHCFSGRGLPAKWIIPLFVLLGWAGAWWGQIYSLGYWDRALIKGLSFGCCMGVSLLLCREREALSVFQTPDRTSLKTAGLLACAVFFFLTVGYMLLAPWIDLSAIPEKKNPLPKILAAAVAVLVLLGGLFFWRSGRQQEVPAVAVEEPIPNPLGITEEELAAIQDVVIIGDYFGYYTYEDYASYGHWPDIHDFAYEVWEGDSGRWYSRMIADNGFTME